MENILENKQYTKLTIYRRPGHYSLLQNMREQGLLCDVTIEVENMKFKAHKILLAATITYFQNIFVNDSEERSKEVIRIKKIRASNMEAFITFAYTGQITLTKDNVQSLIEDADYLDLIDIKEECIIFLTSCLRTENVCKIYRFAEALSYTSLKENSKKFMQQNLRDLLLINDYLNIDIKLLKYILSGDKKQTSSPITTFEAVMKWIIHDINRRKIYLSDLIGFVEFSDISSEFMIDFFFKDGSVAIGLKHSRLMTEVMSIYKKIKTSTLKNEAYYILAVDFSNSNVIKTYDPVSDKWELTKIPGVSNSFYAATVHKDKLYLFGGYAFEKINAVSNVYEPKRKLWKRLSPMKIERLHCGAAALDDFMYVCGGRTVVDRYNYVERYCPEYNEWKTMSPMNSVRSALATVAFDGYIYAIGGRDNYSALSSVERYDPRTNRWTILDSEMKEKRICCGAVALNGKLYVCGGENTILGKSTTSVEVFDPKTNRWEYVASMKSARSNMLVVANMGKLWAIGSHCYTDDTYNSSVEVYDPDTDSWSYAKPISQMKMGVAGGVMSSCSVSSRLS